MKKKPYKRVEFPLAEPLYSTYQYQGLATALAVNNPSIRNYYLSHVMNLSCTKKFLHGFTTPEITIPESQWCKNPYFIIKKYDAQFLGGHVHHVIRKLLDAGYYVCYSGVDDFYVEGKSFFGERHFSHDGCICGYDTADKSYCIYAYDKSWVYRKFWASRASLDRGRRAMERQGVFGRLWGILATDEQVAFDPTAALDHIAEYLDSSLEKYPVDKEGAVYGTAVHDYIALYLDKLYDGSIPHERLDSRVFRLIWEHKKAMLERMRLIEDAFRLDHSLSEAYEEVVSAADHCRMLYASHRVKERREVLPFIRRKLLALKDPEREILQALYQKTNGGKRI